MPQHIRDYIENKARTDGQYAIAYAILQLIEHQKSAAEALHRLGFGNANSEGWGAIESLGAQVEKAAGIIADAIGEKD